jgi:hypothetical protein
MNPLRVVSLVASVVAILAIFAGCAGFRAPSIAPGTPSAEVRSRLGTPSDERTLPGGTKAWDYVQGPKGFTTWRMAFDGSDRVSRVEQLLSVRAFNALPSGKANRADLMNAVGRPGQISQYPRLGEEVWTYRFMDVSVYMLSDVHFDAGSGVMKYVTSYPDPAYYSSIDH